MREDELLIVLIVMQECDTWYFEQEIQYYLAVFAMQLSQTTCNPLAELGPSARRSTL